MTEPLPFETLRLAGATAELPRAMGWLEQRVDAAGLGPRAAYGLTLGVDEALANIATHGFGLEGGGEAMAEAERRIELQYEPRGARVAIRILDNGPAYDPTQHEEAELAGDLDEADLGGHGLRLMKHFLSELTYERREGWNVLTLVSGD